MSTYAESLRASQTVKNKISTPGIYTRYTISNVEKVEKQDPTKNSIKFTFESTTDNTYMDLMLFPFKKDYVANGKVVSTKKQAEDKLVLKLMELCDAIGKQGEIDKYLSADYEKNVATATAYIDKQRKAGGFVNFKVIMDNKDEWTKMSEYAGSTDCPSIEKYVEGKDSKIFFSSYETDKNLHRRMKPRDTSGYKSDKEESTGPAAWNPTATALYTATPAPTFEAATPIEDLPF